MNRNTRKSFGVCWVAREVRGAWIAASALFASAALAEEPPPTAVIGQPASALVFPLFDSRPGHGTLITVTNTQTSLVDCGHHLRPGDVELSYTYFGIEPGGSCLEFDRSHLLTPGDTLTVFTDQDDPISTLGWLWVEARDFETREPIDFDYLIGSAIVVDLELDFLDQYQPYGFRSHVSELPDPLAVDRCGRAFTDLDRGRDADFDGVEYDYWPGRLFIDSFFQEGDGTTGIANDLALASCDVDPFDGDIGTIVSALPWNNSERRFSAQFAFECFFRGPLSTISNVFRHLQGDPSELTLNGQSLETGWLELQGSDAIVGVFLQRLAGTPLAAGHELQFTGRFGSPEDPTHSPCRLRRLD